MFPNLESQRKIILFVYKFRRGSNVVVFNNFISTKILPTDVVNYWQPCNPNLVNTAYRYANTVDTYQTTQKASPKTPGKTKLSEPKFHWRPSIRRAGIVYCGPRPKAVWLIFAATRHSEEIGDV